MNTLLLALAGDSDVRSNDRALALLYLATAEHDDLTPIFGCMTEQIVLLAADAFSQLRAVDFQTQFGELRTAVGKFDRWFTGCQELGDKLATEAEATAEVLWPLAWLVYGHEPCRSCLRVAYTVSMLGPLACRHLAA